MVNNKELIKPLLVFPKPEDTFYFVQILQRKKDHKGVTLGGSNNNSRLVKAYYITSLEKLEVYWEEMVKLAEVFNARISINLNPRSFEKAAFQTLEKIAHQMMNKDFFNVMKAYDSVCGNYHQEMDKRWLVDLDAEDLPVKDQVIDYINTLHKEIDSQSAPERNPHYKILQVLPSKSGVHIITNPFNLNKFSVMYPGIEVHKNNPVNLFIPDFK